MGCVKLHGIIAATVLPMTEAFEIDEAALRSYVARLLDEGVHGLAVNVDTGEGPHLTHDEKLRVLGVVTEVVGGRVPVISGLGAAHTAQAIAWARDLRAAGADALLVFPSSAFRGRPLPVEVPADYYRRVGEEADVPLVLFQLQESLGGVEFPTEVLAALAELPQVIAIKEATFDRARFVETVGALRDADITVLTGNDNFIHESFTLGAEGALIGFGTLATRAQVAMVEAHVAGDHVRAAALGETIQRLADVIFAPPIRDYRVRLKEALRMLGVIPNAVIRPPLMPVSDAERARIRAALVEAGLKPVAP
jgi:4-hydroxy-tetrahydrodipicolinate synthase